MRKPKKQKPTASQIENQLRNAQDLVKQAGERVNLAKTYLEDGALKTASDLLYNASALLLQASVMKFEAMEAAARTAPKPRRKGNAAA